MSIADAIDIWYNNFILTAINVRTKSKRLCSLDNSTGNGT